MKKLSLLMIIFWSFIGLVIIAAIIAGTVISRGEGRGPVNFFSTSDRSNMQLVVDEAITTDGISDISLHLFSDDCTVYITDDDKISVKHYARNIPAGRHARLENRDGGLTVSTKPVNIAGFQLFSFGNNSAVDIYLPKAYEETLRVELASGTVRFNDSLDLSGLAVKVSSGTIRSDNAVKAEEVALTVTSGTIKLLGGLTADNYAIKSSSGSISVGKSLVGSGSVNVTSGTVKLEGVEITEGLSVKVSSGNINIGVAGNPSLKFSGRRTSGTIRAYFGTYNDGRSFSTTIGDAPYKNLDVGVTSGTVRITQE